MKKKSTIICIIIIILIIAIGGTVFWLNKNKQPKKSTTKVVATNQNINKVKNMNAEKTKEIKDGLKLFNNKKYLVGKIGNNNLIIDLTNININNSAILTTSYYTNQGVKLDTKIEYKNGKYIITELYNNTPIGIYNLDNNNGNLEGNFNDLENKANSLENVAFKFVDNVDSYKKENIYTIGFIKNIYQTQILDKLPNKSIPSMSTSGVASYALWNGNNKELKKLQTEYNSGINGNMKIMDMNLSGVILEIINRGGSSGNVMDVNSTMNNDSPIGKASYIINGEKAWEVKVQPVQTWIQGGQACNLMLIGENGMIYNNTDVYKAAQKGQLLILNSIMPEPNNVADTEYTKLDLSKEFTISQSSSTALVGNGGCSGLITSNENQDNQESLNYYGKLRAENFEGKMPQN